MQSDSALEKKRRFALERAERLKDPRQRLMGIDKNALDEQVKERKALETMERDREAFFDTQSMLMDKHAQVLQREADDIRRQREREIKDFRETFQRKDLSREWDLQDPKRIVEALPARVNDDDGRCGAASMQKFEGEDLDSRHRRQAQAEQLRNWCHQQKDEKLMKKWMEKESNRQYEDRAEEMAFRTWQVERDIAAQRRQMAVTTTDFNKQLAEQKRREKLLDRKNQTLKNLEEIENHMNSDMLNERPPVVAQGAALTQSDRFRGFNHDDLSSIRATQAAQREQMRQKSLEDAEEARQWAQQEQLENRMGLALDRQRARERREAATKLGEERKAQAAEAAARKKAMNDLYRNQIGEEYFVWGKCI